MSQPNQPSTPGPVRLVQIERRANTAPANQSFNLPKQSAPEIYRKKAYIAFRKIAGFLYTDHSYGAARRWLLPQILPDKVLYRWQPYRKGECNRCGLCCKIVYRCPFFVEHEQGTACSIYTDPKHFPSACVAFPIDPRDIQEVHKQIAPAPCPFHFEGAPEHPTTWGALKAYWREEWEKRLDKVKEAFDF
jgi:hypothetical protein